MAKNNPRSFLLGGQWEVPLLDLLFMLIIILIMMVTPTKEDSEKPPGNLVVESTWDNSCDTDVDQWVLAPGDRPVGYSNKSGKVFNLLRDDLGFFNDASNTNIEFSFARWVPDGEYVVNLHLYKNRVCPTPIRVYVRVFLADDSRRLIYQGESLLTHEDHELTVIRFTVVGNSVLDLNTVQRPLRSG